MRTASFALCFFALSASAAAAGDCYAPTPEETARYQAIAKRLAGEQTPGTLTSLSQQEVQWALMLEQRVMSQGYQPTEQELAAYTDIARRVEASPVPVQSTAAPSAEDPARDFTEWSAPAQTPAPSRVSEQDIDWAQDLEARVKRGEKPSREEIGRYEDVFRRMQASLAAGQAPPPARPPEPREPGSVPAPVSEQDIAWALDLEARVKRGENPTGEETSRYEDVARRLAAFQAAEQAQPAARPPEPRKPAAGLAPVSEEDMAWAIALQTRVQGGATASEAEIERYDDIYRRHQATESPPPPTWNVSGASEADIQWALDLERKVKGPCPAP